jgi:hypothetical protein
MSKYSEELAYFNKVQAEEKKRIVSCLQDVSSSADEHTKQVIADLITDVSSRVRVVEEYLAKHIDSNDSTFKPINPDNDTVMMPANNEAKVSIIEWEQLGKLGPLNYNAKGLPYRFVMSSTEVSKEIQINRSKKMTLAIDIEYSSSLRILQQMEIFIDGVKVKHRITDSHRRLIVHIPRRKKGGNTHMMIKSPELQQDEKLALSDIYIVPKLSILGMLRKILD